MRQTLGDHHINTIQAGLEINPTEWPCRETLGICMFLTSLHNGCSTILWWL